MAHIDVIREHFAVVNNWIYMNHAAVSPLSRDMVFGLDVRAADLLENGDVNVAAWEEDAIQARMMYAQILGCFPDEVAFLNGTSDGINLIANGLDWKPGDNVVLPSIEYPANVYPWMNQAPRGLEIKWVAPREDGRIAVEDIEKAIDARTRVLAVSFVQFTNGFRLDLKSLGEICARRNVFFLVDAIQGLGALDLDVRAAKIDALVAHSRKWLLCQPGYGVLYVSRQRLGEIRVTNPGAYSVVEPERFLDYRLEYRDGARRFEPGGLDPVALSATRAMLAMFTGLGMAFIEAQVLAITDALAMGVKARGYRLLSPRGDGEKSGILAFAPASAAELEAISARLKEARVIHTCRDGYIRLSPHFYNSAAEVEEVLNLL